MCMYGKSKVPPLQAQHRPTPPVFDSSLWSDFLIPMATLGGCPLWTVGMWQWEQEPAAGSSGSAWCEPCGLYLAINVFLNWWQWSKKPNLCLEHA